MEVRPGYKQTEAGVIPKDWGAKPLAGQVVVLHGFGFQSKHFTKLGEYRLTTPGHFHEAGGFRDVGDKQKFYDGPLPDGYLLQRGDLIVAMTEQADGLLGSAALVPSGGSYLHNQRLGKIRVLSADLSARFLYRIFNSPMYRAKVRETAAGTKVKHTSPARLLEIVVPLPPTKAEQEAIAEALSNADALIESLEQLLAKNLQLKQGAMQDLLTGRKRLPGFSGEWEVKPLGDLFNFSGGFTASRDQLSSGGSCYLHYGDIHASKKSFVDVRSEYQDIPKLDVPLKKVSSVSLLDDGDVVFVDASEDDEGTSKHVVIMNPHAVPFISGLHTIVAKGKTNALAHQYRRYCFQTTAVKAQFRFFAVGTKVSGISKSNIARITLPVPSLPEQTAIAAIFSDMDAEIAAVEARIAKAREIQQGMMQELLTGRIRLI